MRPGTFLFLDGRGFALVTAVQTARRTGGGLQDNRFRVEVEGLTVDGHFVENIQMEEVLEATTNPAEFCAQNGLVAASEIADILANYVREYMAESCLAINDNPFVAGYYIADLAEAYASCVAVMNIARAAGA